MNSMAALLLLAALATPASAGQAIAEGDRVRVTLLERPHERVVGTLLAIRPEAIDLRPDSVTRTIARPDIDKLEVSRGIHSGSRDGVKYGAIVGGVTLGALGALASEINNSESSVKSNTVAVALAYTLAGAVVGGGLGALIGSAFHHERWERIPAR